MPDSAPQSHTSQTPRKPHPRTRSAEPSSQQHRASRQAASNPKKPQRKKSRYIPSLDGLRALAVLAVIFYHMDFAWAKGGLLGVTVFFVLSGYLITGLLISEYDSTGGIDLPQFWLRRIRRLVPAIITVIVCVAVLCTLFNHVLLTKMRPDIVPSLFFFNNWWQIFHNVSYFEALGAPSPLTHFWSLAIEEQFYVVWPLLLLGAFKLGANRTWVRRVILVLAAASALAMALLYVPGGDPSRVYYGTDTRAFSLLLGAWLAFSWPSSDFASERALHIDKQMKTILNAIGFAALAVLVLMLALMDGFSAFPYRGGVLLASAVAAVLIAILVHPATLLYKIFSNKILVWIGVRSYGMYLWHYPIVLLMTGLAGNAEGTPLWLAILEIALIFGVSELSYRFIEDPIRHRAIGKLITQIREGETTLQRFLQRKAIPALASVTMVAVAFGGVLLVPDASAVEDTELYKDESAAVVGVPSADEAQTVGNDSNGSTSTTTEATKLDDSKLDILMIGDSVAKGCIYSFSDIFPHGALDAAVGRYIDSGITLYQQYNDQGIVGNVVVFCLGNNGPSYQDIYDNLIATIGPDKQIFFVNTRNETTWMDDVNATYANGAVQYENVHVIDWYTTSAGHDEYFDGDGTHLTREGGLAYLNAIYDAVKDYIPQRDADNQDLQEGITVGDNPISEEATYIPALATEE